MNSISLAQNLDFQPEELLNSTVNNPATTIRSIAVEKHITNDQGGSQTSDKSIHRHLFSISSEPSEIRPYLQQQEHYSSSSDKAPNLAEPILPSNDNSENNQAINQAEQTSIDVYNQSQEVIILDDMQWLDTFEVGEGNMLGPDVPYDGFIAELLAKTENDGLNETLAIIENPDLLSTLIGKTGNNKLNSSTAVANAKSMSKPETNRETPLTDPIYPLSTIRTPVAQARLTRLQKVQIRKIKEAECIAAIKASLITLGEVRKKNDSVKQVLLDALNKIKTAKRDEAVVLPKPKSEPGKWEETKKPNGGRTKEDNVRSQSKYQKHIKFIYKDLKDNLKLDCQAKKLAVLEELKAALAELPKPDMYVLAGDDQETVAEAGLSEPASLCPSPGPSRKRPPNELNSPGYGSGAATEGDESSQKMSKLETNRKTPLTDPINSLSTIRTSGAKTTNVVRNAPRILGALNLFRRSKGMEPLVLPKPPKKVGRPKGAKVLNKERTQEENKEKYARRHIKYKNNITFIYENLKQDLELDCQVHYSKPAMLKKLNEALAECTGLTELDTLIRDNFYQFSKCTMCEKRPFTQYPKELREEAVALVVEQGYSVSDAAKSLGISASSLYEWMDHIEALKEGIPK